MRAAPLGGLPCLPARADKWRARGMSTARKSWLIIIISDSIVVSISACHAEDPGSIPSRGSFSAGVAHTAERERRRIKNNKGEVERGHRHEKKRYEEQPYK